MRITFIYQWTAGFARMSDEKERTRIGRITAAVARAIGAMQGRLYPPPTPPDWSHLQEISPGRWWRAAIEEPVVEQKEGPPPTERIEDDESEIDLKLALASKRRWIEEGEQGSESAAHRREVAKAYPGLPKDQAVAKAKAWATACRRNETKHGDLEYRPPLKKVKPLKK